MFNENKDFFKGAALVGGATVIVVSVIVVFRKFF